MTDRAPNPQGGTSYRLDLADCATPPPATRQHSGEIHEHACVRCALLRVDPAQRPRLEEIRDNLHARIAEAEHKGWLGEVEGLKVSLAGTEDKLAQIQDTLTRRDTTIPLGMPTFTDLAGRTAPE
ncbi:hypothetical protein [Leekyejoonella antrihumi]|uniref:hypothetical protein n=1 Tax=Leekyejoonella antrihumi TaxID=1660198 RepID=UPI001C97A32B|nr:hypothetical protein [Leekyejoonella antrihumi]